LAFPGVVGGKSLSFQQIPPLSGTLTFYVFWLSLSRIRSELSYLHMGAAISSMQDDYGKLWIQIN